MLVAMTVATDLIHSLRLPVEAIAQHNPALADQVRRAGSSVVLNVAEGARRAGRDRLHLFRVAAGSAAEVQAALAVASAWGYVAEDRLTAPRALLDRELGLLWGLTHTRR